MAVYERKYRRYAGPITPEKTRVLVLPRYAMSDLFQSRAMVSFFALCFAYPLFCAAVIYIRHNAEKFLSLNIQIADLLAIDAGFFSTLLDVQGTFAFLLALFVGPGLISRDLANNGLPLYLYRPFTRAEYVFGKFMVLAGLLSLVTWVPGLLLFALQGSLAGAAWMGQNLRIAVGLFVGAWIWIALIALLALAFSAWVKWRPVAGFLMLFVLFTGSFIGFLFNQLFRTKWGDLLNLDQMMNIVWAALLGLEDLPKAPSVGAAWMSLLTFTAFCLFLLHRKIRAYEVVS